MGFFKKIINVSKQLVNTISTSSAPTQKQNQTPLKQKSKDKKLSKKEQQLLDLTNQATQLKNYTENNANKFCNVVYSLKKETEDLINKISDITEIDADQSSSQLLQIENANIKKYKNLAIENLKYLYLAKDYFSLVSKMKSGLALSESAYIFIVKFAPFFDGTKVLKKSKKDDESIMKEFREIKNEILGVFTYTKKTDFSFDDYLKNYKGKINALILPNIETEIESLFCSTHTLHTQNNSIHTHDMQDINNTQKENTTLKCPNCKTILQQNTKFCPECGIKIDQQKKLFCSECGAPLNNGSKFCSECGHKVI